MKMGPNAQRAVDHACATYGAKTPRAALDVICGGFLSMHHGYDDIWPDVFFAMTGRWPPARSGSAASVTVSSAPAPVAASPPYKRRKQSTPEERAAHWKEYHSSLDFRNAMIRYVTFYDDIPDEVWDEINAAPAFQAYIGTEYNTYNNIDDLRLAVAAFLLGHFPQDLIKWCERPADLGPHLSRMAAEYRHDRERGEI